MLQSVSNRRNATPRSIGFSGLALLSFLCGATNDISFNMVGELFVAELLLVLLAGMLLLVRGSGGAFNTRIFWAFLLTGLVMLVGYMLSDLYVGTPPAQYLRGWGRVVLLMSNCVALMILTAHNRQNLWWFMLGTGLGGITYLAIHGVPIHVWKIGYGERFGIALVALTPILPRKLWPVIIAGFGVLCFILDYRSLGAAFIVVAGIIWARSKRPDEAVRSFVQYMRFFVIAGVALLLVLLSLLLTQGEYASRRTDSSIGRYVAITVALRAIIDSPVVGYGSWTVNEKYANMVRQEVGSERGFDSPSPLLRGNEFHAHSQILQSWVEGGLLGAAFFIFYGFALFNAIRLYIVRHPLDFFYPVFLYMLLLGMWNWLASPFLGIERIQIAMAVAVITAIKLVPRAKAHTTALTPATDVRNPALMRFDKLR